jgi:hypothetical protein
MVSRKQKKIDALKRREAFKEQRKSILIVCEGSKTEPIYFNSLKKKLRIIADVDVVGAGAVPITVVNRAIEKRGQQEGLAKTSLIKVEYEIVYCVFDVEMPKQHKSLLEAINKAKANGLEVILSNPCFEYWYILHFVKTSSPFYKNENVISVLKKYHKTYSKGDDKIFDIIYPNTKQAIQNSKQVIKEHHNDATDLQNCNPSTNVHLIVEEFLKMVQ